MSQVYLCEGTPLKSHYHVSGLNSEGFWETLGSPETLPESEAVYQASDPLKYSIVQIHRRGELIMTSDPTEDTPLKERMIPTSEGHRIFCLRKTKGQNATRTSIKKVSKREAREMPKARRKTPKERNIERQKWLEEQGHRRHKMMKKDKIHK